MNVKPHLTHCPVCGADNQLAPTFPYSANPAASRWDANHCFRDSALAICPACHFGYIAQTLSDENLNDFYSMIYRTDPKENSEDAFPPFPELNSRFLSQAIYLKTFIPLVDGMKILEIGSSRTGVVPTLSLFFRPEYYYFDQKPSPLIESYGGKRIGSFATEAELRRNIQPESLDLVYMSHSLEHISPAALGPLINSIHQTLRPGGYFFVEVPNELPHDRPPQVVPPHTIFFNESNLRLFFERHGFRVQASHSFGDFAQLPVASATPPPNPAKFPKSTKQALLENQAVYRLVRPWLKRRFFEGALRNLKTPYETFPHVRIIGEKIMER